jgi:heme/copper-type cytochrome/quinol oxidase subunit 1
MQLSAPKLITWWIALILGVLGVIANFVVIPVLSGFAFWLVVIGLALLLLATLIEGL